MTLLDAAGVDPEVFKTILRSLFCAKANLLMTEFLISQTVIYILKGNLVVVTCPSVGEYRIRGNLVADFKSRISRAGTPKSSA
jgi:hypothetical protein